MATVKLTSILESEIATKLERAYEPRLKQVREEVLNSLSADDVLNCYIENTGGHALYQQVSEWLPSARGLQVYRYGGKHFGMANTDFKESRKYPNGIDNALQSGAEYFAPIFAKFFELKQKFDDLVKERDDTRVSIIDAFRAFPSINAAVKTHPDLEHMLPDSAKDKMAQKVERNRNQAVDVKVDTTKIKTIATLNKIYAGV